MTKKQRKGGSRFSDAEKVRSIVDLAEIARLLKEGGSLPTDETESSRFSVLAKVPEPGARRVIRIRSLIRLPSVCSFIQENKECRVLQDREFSKGNLSIANGGGVMSIDFIEAFIPAEESVNWSSPGALRTMSYQFLPPARETILLITFKITTVLSTVCGWLSESLLGDLRETKKALERVTCVEWAEARSMCQSNTAFSVRHMVEGWHIVMETMKVCVQDLYYEEVLQKSGKQCGSLTTVQSDTFLLADAVEKKSLQWSQCAVVEVMTWLFSKVMKKQSISEFHAMFDEPFSAVLKRVAKLVGSCEGEVRLPAAALDHTLRCVIDGGPTLAEIRFNPTNMIPEVRKCQSRVSSIDVVKVAQRCRPNRSYVQSLYEKWASKMKSAAREGLPVSGDQLSTKSMDPALSGGAGSSTQPRLMTHKRTDIQPKHSREEMDRWVRKVNEPLPLLLDNREERTSPSNVIDRQDRNMVRNGFCCYDADPCDSENDDNYLPKDVDDRLDMMIDELLEKLFEELLRWRVDSRFSSGTNLLDGNADWLDYWYRLNDEVLKCDPGRTGNPERYAKLWMAFIVIELRGSVIDSIDEELPKLKENPTDFYKAVFTPSRSSVCDMIRCIVRKVGHSRLLTNMKTDSTDVHLNRKIVDEFSGMSLCVGYLEKRGNDKMHSPLSLFLCRSLHVEGEDIDRVGLEGRVDRVDMRLCVNRRLFKKFGIGEEDVLHIQPLCNIASLTRMYKAVNSIHTLPTRIQLALFTDYIIEERRLVSDTEVKHVNEDLLRVGIDRSVYEFLKMHMSNGGTADPRQLSAACRVMEGVGDAGRGSSSATLIQGPPGTGKTTCIDLLVACVMHHSSAGHMGGAEVNYLKKDDGIRRCKTGTEPMRIMICGPSNRSVDNAMLRIVEHGIPDGHGGSRQVQMIRIARAGYDLPKKLRPYGVNEKALALDNELFDVESKLNRKFASTKARRAIAEESILVFMTLSLTGSSKLKQLRQPFDMIIVDEAGQAFEPDTLIPFVNLFRRSTLNRQHIVMLGDHKQLSAVSHGAFFTRKARLFARKAYEDMCKSLFERLFRKRVPSIMLNRQYRMHPAISDTILPVFYGMRFQNVFDREHFREPYTDTPAIEGGYAPLTIVDTSLSGMRFENRDSSGGVYNAFEILVVRETLARLRAFDDSVREKICVISPYNLQVNKLIEHFDSEERGWRKLRKLRVELSTVDSKQGGEDDIIIFSAVRSNKDKQVGFLSITKRINVALTRAKKLLIIIGDVSTLTDTQESAFSKIMDSVNEKLRINGMRGNDVLVIQYDTSEAEMEILKGETGGDESDSNMSSDLSTDTEDGDEDMEDRASGGDSRDGEAGESDDAGDNEGGTQGEKGMSTGSDAADGDGIAVEGGTDATSGVGEDEQPAIAEGNGEGRTEEVPAQTEEGGVADGKQGATEDEECEGQREDDMAMSAQPDGNESNEVHAAEDRAGKRKGESSSEQPKGQKRVK